MSPVLALVASALAQDPAALVYDYRGPTGEGSKTAAEIVALVRAAPRAEHLVRGPGAPDWRPWKEVPELALVWLRNVPVTEEPASPSEAPVAPTSPSPGAGGEPPRNAPPAAADPVPAPSPRVAARLGGDVRIDFVATNLERLAGEGDAPPAGFTVSRVRPIVDVTLGDHLFGRVAVETRMDESTSSYEDLGAVVEVRDWADAWSIQGREVWLAARFGTAFRQEVRLGLQEPAFGVRDTYEERYPFAGEARADYARELGVIPEEDLGIGWRGRVGERLALDAQVLNGSGGASLDRNDGKDLVARAAVDVGPVTVSASGLYGMRATDGSGSQAQGALAVDLHGPNQRILVEGLVGTTTEDDLDTVFAGYAVTGAWDVPLSGPVLDTLTFVARANHHDPVSGIEAPDAWWRYGAGGWLAWKVHPGHTVRTGATWHAYVPQNADLPVENEVVAEAAWRF